MAIGPPAAELSSAPVAYSPSAIGLTAAFGVGESGLALSVSFVGATAVEDFTSMAAGVSGFRGVSTEIGLQQKSISAVRINDHLSHCSPGEGAGVAATSSNLLYGGTGVTGPLVMASLVLFLAPGLPPFRSPGTFLPSSTHRAGKNCYNPAL